MISTGFSRRCKIALLLIGLVALVYPRTFIQGQTADPLANTAVITAANVKNIKILSVFGKGAIYQALWLPDGKTLAVSSSQGVYLFDTTGGPEQAGTLLKPLPAKDEVKSPNPDETSLAVSGDGKFVAAASQSLVSVWNVESRKLIQTIISTNVSGLLSGTPYLAWSPDGKYLAFTSATIELFDPQTGKLVSHFGAVPSQPASSGYSYPQWSPDSQQIMAVMVPYSSQGGKIDVWTVGSKKLAFTIKLPDNTQQTALAWSSDGKWILGADASSVKVWDASNGKLTQTLTVDQGFENTSPLSVSPDSKQVARCVKGMIQIWDLDGLKPGAVISNTNSAYPECNRVLWSPDGKFIAMTNPEGVWQIDPAGAAVQGDHLLVRFTPISSNVAYSPDGTLLATEAGPIRLWDANTGKLVRMLNASPLESSWQVAWSPNGKYMATGNGLWDVTNPDPLFQLDQRTLTRAVAWSADGKFVAIGVWDGGEIEIWDASTGKLTQTLTGHEAHTLAIDWAATGQIASGGRDGKVRIWDVALGKAVQEFTIAPPNKSPPESIAVRWSPDGKLLASVSQKYVLNVWDASTGKSVISITRAGAPVLWDVRWSPDGKLIAMVEEYVDGRPPALIFVDVASGKVVSQVSYPGRSGGVSWNITWSPDGKRIVMSSIEGVDFIRVWGVPQS